MDPAPAPEASQTRPPLQERRSRHLTPKRRIGIVSVLVWDLKDSLPDNKFQRGTITFAAKLCRVTPKTVRSVWTRALESFRESGSFSASPVKKKNCGRKLRKREWNHDKVKAAIDAVPLDQKKTPWDLAVALGMKAE